MIGEASGLINLAHLAQAVAQPRPVGRRTGTMPIVTAQDGSAPAAAPAAAQRGAGWTKWLAVVGIAGTLALGGAVVYLVTRPKPESQVVIQARGGASGPIVLEQEPVYVQASKDNGRRSGHRGAGVRRNEAQHAGSAAANPTGVTGLLADDSPIGHELKGVDRPQSGTQVSQQAILGVVTQNRRSLNACYDRVLKHDSSLRRARVVTHVKIGISGRVTAVTIPDPQYAKSEIGECLAQAIRRWNFPASDAEYETEFPILLQAN